MSEAQELELRALLAEHEELFTDVPGLCSVEEHQVKLTTDEPVRSKPYPMPYHVRKELRAEIDEMKRLGIIRESDSAYASPVVIVRKKDGSNRICVDYRRLNKVTVFDPEPMAQMSDVFQSLGKDQYFSKFDLSKGYYQLAVSPEDVHKTSFVIQDGKFEFLRMPFGMMNSGATLTRCLRTVLQGVENVHNFLDDVLVHSQTWEEHLEALKEVLGRFAKAGLTVKPSKCEIAAAQIDFLGHRIEKGRIAPHEDNVEKIKRAPRPRTKKEVRSFLGLTGFYRDHIADYAAKAVPLTDLTRNGKPNRVEWGESQERAYETLKTEIAKEPILHLPVWDEPFVLRTDASYRGLGACIMQEHFGKLYPVCYASRKLLERESRYAATEKECLAIVWAVKKFELYLRGAEFLLQTDCKALSYLGQAKFTNDRLMRYAMFLQDFKFRVRAIKGTENFGADFLSRVFEDAPESISGGDKSSLS